MFEYNENIYSIMLGNIKDEYLNVSPNCVSQCTGCMCSCRCSCSGGIIPCVEWEEI